MSLTPGARLGPYEILSAIGAGGMGEVYKARDTRLDRTVAIKVSAQRFSERFEREARTIGSLNHPNICTLYDVGPNYLARRRRSYRLARRRYDMGQDTRENCYATTTGVET